MENNFKRRLEDMYGQSSPSLSSKRKRRHETTSFMKISKEQTPRKSILEPFEKGYKRIVSSSRITQGTPFTEIKRTFTARPYVGETTTSYVVGSPSDYPRTPLRQRHYSPRNTWVSGAVARSRMSGIRFSSTPEVLSSSAVPDSPSQFAKTVGHGFFALRGIADWSSSVRNFIEIGNRRSRLTSYVSEVRPNGVSKGRLVSRDLDLAKCREEFRAVEKKFSCAVRREPGMGNDLCPGGRENSEHADVTESDALRLKDYERSIASLQGDDERLSVIKKTCSNLQHARFVPPDCALNEAVCERIGRGTGEEHDDGTRQTGEKTGEGGLASTSESRDGKSDHKAGDWRALYERAKSRDGRLNSLTQEQEYLAKKFAAIAVDRPTFFGAVKKDERDPADAFRPLSEEAENDVDDALSGSDRNKVLTFHEKSSIDVTRAVMQCLQPGAWLNDEVINLYMELLKERELQEPKKFLKCHFFNTFFYNKLYKDKRSYDYKAVRRWTTQKKLGYSLSDCDKILVPIHQDIHWCLAVINIRDKKLEYLDSLKGVDNAVLKVLARYIADEAKDKDGKVLDASTWEHEFPEDIPQQLNGCDCGMFMLKYADFHSRGVPLSFKQEEDGLGVTATESDLKRLHTRCSLKTIDPDAIVTLRATGVLQLEILRSQY